MLGLGLATVPRPRASRTASTPAVEAGPARPGPFGIDVRRGNDLAVVQIRGELDLATVETLRAALEGIEDVACLVVDLRDLSFIDATGLRLLAALHGRAQRGGVRLTFVAPAAPTPRAIGVSGLSQTLPFVAAADAVDRDPRASTSSPLDGIR